MADNKPINWAYPFKTAGEDSKEVSDPQIYLDALAKAKDGFYPMGTNGLWHGGVHFDDNTAGSLDQSSIRCIADGEVIAYRIDQRYPTTQYGDGPTVVHLPFSTGFVLVRHRLDLPSLPAPTAPAGEPGDTTTAATPTDTASSPAASTESAPASEGLTFYSLYMHLLDWDSYKSATAPEPAEFLAPTCYAVKSTTDDPLVGLRVRALNDDGTNKVLALLPKGCKVTLGEAHSIKTKYKKLLSIDEGVAIPALPAGIDGWVYEDELTGNTVADKATDTESELTLSHQGVRVRREGKGNGTIIGVLPRGATLKVEAKGKKGYCKVLEVMDSRGVPALPNGPDGKPLGYVFFDALEAQKTEPVAPDSVYILPKPYSIKAGELVGHIGKYQNQDEGTAKKRLHLEVFTSEDVPAFIEKSRAIGEKLPDEQKTLIKVETGSKIAQPAAADTQVDANVDVRLCSDSPKAGCWVKVQKYAICNADKNSELGSYNTTKFTYPLSAAQKTLLASRMGVDAADMPDQVDFLKVYSNSVEGGDPHDYESGSIPSTHPWRKIGAVVGKPFWVKRSAVNAQGQRSSTAGSLDAWKEFPLHSGLEGKASGYVRILPASSWDALPDERKAIDAEQVRWWYVTVGDMEGNDISGWAPEKDLIVTRHSPWEWPGFSTLQDKVSLDAHLARTLDATGRATEEETESYAALIEEAERGPILSKLYEIIDQPDEKGVRDKKLTPAEFQAALAKPWLAQQLSLLISQHESEWFWNESKWSQLDKLMEHTLEDPNPQWVREKERIKTLSWWKELAGQFPLDGGNAWHINLVGIVSNFISRRGCNCKADVKVTRWKSKHTGNIYYGPVHWGTNRLSQAAQWSELISAGYVTKDDKEIICVMTENEGKIEAVQSYDSEIITAGAMQKIISIDGVGEFPKQVNKFKELHPDLYVEFFESQGWYLDSASVTPKMFYQHVDWKGGVRLEGEDLKSSLREGCSEDTVGKTIDCPPVSSIACAISSPEYVKLQIMDYIDRLRSALSKKPTGYAYSANELFKSKLGRGLVLDHDINKPAFVADDLKAAVDKFHLNNPAVSEDIRSWGEAHAENEQKIIEYYGPERRMTEANKRYENLKLEL